MSYSTIVGIDAHARKNSVCALVLETGEVRRSTLSGDPAQLVSWIDENDFPTPLHCVYESGPTGFGLARSLGGEGIPCTVAAVSKLPRRTDRQKNDKRDAEWLARMLACGSVRPVRVPSPEEEALCHLSRLRGEVAADLRRAKQRVASFLLLTRTSYTLTKARWTKTFYQWAGSYEFEQAADTFVFRMKMNAVLRLAERLAEVESEILRIISGSAELAGRMARFECIHGIGRVGAFSLVCEVYDFERFRNGAAFASFMGLVPSESSSGGKTSHGKIAKTGNSHLRRILVEAAGCYSRGFKAVRREDPRVPEAVRAKAEKCAKRLMGRRAALRKRNVNPNKAKTAIARELCEWIYHIAVMPA
ncbi:MAG: IS110 family transposase [Gordonibacter pamelaeae]|uniref:IS110 family transposase n=1 Tax=Gordonibacter massiliensis (ex Traore et al. 2017) TaxID=1841863 RepID=UPI001C8B826E|nr:IS110 family transposase [Gordonibacter massiliensis (ex Traore et al. 2017)]MBX9035475.1 IS110 family transposase [Gordonibacter massiliensis (ex Traore et al. 2017)]